MSQNLDILLAGSEAADARRMTLGELALYAVLAAALGALAALGLLLFPQGSTPFR